MKNKYIIVGVVLILFSINVIGQNLTDNNSTLIENYFNNSSQQVVPLNPKGKGIANYKINTDITITQKGNYNRSSILSHSKNKQTLSQIGDRNNYEYFSYYNSNPSTVNTLQQGDNNSVQMFGQNELAKNISIIQNTDNKTLIIKNY